MSQSFISEKIPGETNGLMRQNMGKRSIGIVCLSIKL